MWSGWWVWSLTWHRILSFPEYLRNPDPSTSKVSSAPLLSLRPAGRAVDTYNRASRAHRARALHSRYRAHSTSYGTKRSESERELKRPEIETREGRKEERGSIWLIYLRGSSPSSSLLPCLSSSFTRSIPNNPYVCFMLIPSLCAFSFFRFSPKFLKSNWKKFKATHRLKLSFLIKLINWVAIQSRMQLCYLCLRLKLMKEKNFTFRRGSGKKVFTCTLQEMILQNENLGYEGFPCFEYFLRRGASTDRMHVSHFFMCKYFVYKISSSKIG